MIRSEILLFSAIYLYAASADRGDKEANEAGLGPRSHDNHDASTASVASAEPRIADTASAQSKDLNVHVQVRPSAVLQQETSPFHKKHKGRHSKSAGQRPGAEAPSGQNKLQATHGAQAGGNNQETVVNAKDRGATPSQQKKEVSFDELLDLADAPTQHVKETTLSPAAGARREIESLGAGSPAEKLKMEESRLEKEEHSALEPGLSALAKAVEEPRRFLLGIPGMSEFVTGLRAAVELQGSNKCLRQGEFKGFGCQAHGKNPSICQCGGLLERCWAETDEARIVRAYSEGNRAVAWAEAKSLLFGQCYTSAWLVSSVVVGGLLLTVFTVLIAVIIKNWHKSGGSIGPAFSNFVGSCMEKLPKSVRFAKNADEQTS